MSSHYLLPRDKMTLQTLWSLGECYASYVISIIVSKRELVILLPIARLNNRGLSKLPD